MQKNQETQGEAGIIPGNDEMTEEELDEVSGGIRKGLDSKSEMGEMESLRLQMAMDRMSKMMSTLSNIEKKASAAGAAITQNIK